MQFCWPWPLGFVEPCLAQAMVAGAFGWQFASEKKVAAGAC